MSRMEANEKRRIVEALILSSAEPISAARIAEIIPYCDEGQAKDLVSELNTEYGEQDRSFEIWEVAGGFQIRTRAEFSGYLQKLQKERALRLSQAALETLAIIAYRQPTTRAEIEDVRGVDAGATVKSLLERHLIRIAGQREVPGRPMVYATTRRFLEVFGLERLKDLPTLRELDELAREQGLLERAGEGADVIHIGVASEEADHENGVTNAITEGVFAPSPQAGSPVQDELLDDHESVDDAEDSAPAGATADYATGDTADATKDDTAGAPRGFDSAENTDWTDRGEASQDDSDGALDSETADAQADPGPVEIKS